MDIRLTVLDDRSRTDVLTIDRSDVSEDWVDSIPHILELTQYGLDHGFIGHTYVIYADDTCIGIILMGEGIPWACDPAEIASLPFYRIMGFILDRQWRSRGIGGQVLEMVIDRIYAEFGARPIVLGVQEDNMAQHVFMSDMASRPPPPWMRMTVFISVIRNKGTKRPPDTLRRSFTLPHSPKTSPSVPNRSYSGRQAA